MKFVIIDALGSERGARRFTRDVIGAGPRMIAGILKKFAINSQIMTAEQFLNTKKHSSEINGLFVSAMTMDFYAVKRVIRKWEQISKNNERIPLNILGGSITAAFNTILSQLNFNIAIIGEAEETLSDLIQKDILKTGINFSVLEKIPGIAYRSSQNIIKTPRRPFISKDQLNSFHPSTQHITDYPFYRAARIFIECVRGCSNFHRTKIELPDGRICNNCGTCLAAELTKRLNCPLSIPPGCGYCSVPALYGPPRSRSITNIIKEMKELINLGVSRLILGASDFLDYQREELTAPSPLTDPRDPPPNYKEIENLLAHIAQLIADTEIYISIENIKASLFTEKAAALLASYLPNTTLSIGCETGSKAHSQQLGRPFLPEEVLKAVNIAKKHNLRSHVYFIHGLPGQTLQTAIQTSRFMKKLAES
ncbi:MAG TPA: radical SAM protein, partial [Candidatus Deferrimicrobium sp.]|nr:radical SAM protein [Candidatus Deferrimicrobium sp.]